MIWILSRSQWLIAAAVFAFSSAVPAMAGVAGAQSKAAEQLLAALAVGNAQEAALAFHPDELTELRTSLLSRLRAEDVRGEATVRGRLFGPGRPLADIEKLTGVRFYAELAQRLQLRSRPYQSVKWLAAVADGKQVHVVGRGKPPRDLGDVETVVLVTLVPYGKSWRAAIPSEIAAQIDDLLADRQIANGQIANGNIGNRDSALVTPVASTGVSPTAVKPTDPAVSELFDAAEQALVAGRCTEYYTIHMSPNFRRSTSTSAQRSLVNACERSDATRETLVSSLRIARTLAPTIEASGNRAVYDVTNQGLPFSRFVLERIEQRWYIAE